jgi:hypothetical protein
LMELADGVDIPDRGLRFQKSEAVTFETWSDMLRETGAGNCHRVIAADRETGRHDWIDLGAGGPGHR